MPNDRSENFYGTDVPVQPVNQSQRIEINATTLSVPIPAWAKRMRFTLIGGDGGSGSGARGAANALRSGGSSGSAGNRSIGEFVLADVAARLGLAVSALQLEVEIGLGGTPGAAITTDNTDGANGTSGATSYLYFRNASGSIRTIHSFAAGGTGGLGGRRNGVSTSGGTAVTALGTFVGASGAAGSNSAGSNGLASNEGPGSGGGGGGAGTGPVLAGANIGTLSAPGGFTQNAANAYQTYVFTNIGSGGTPLAGLTSDNIYFAQAPFSATDFSIVANFAPVFPLTNIAERGMMLRDGLAANAPFFAIGAANAAGETVVFVRGTAGAPVSAFVSAFSSGSLWRLRRLGSVLSAQASSNGGLTWSTVVGTGSAAAWTDPRLGIYGSVPASGTQLSMTVSEIRITGLGGSASFTAPASFGTTTLSTGPGLNASTNLLPGSPGSGGGGGRYEPGTAGAPGGRGARGGSGGGGSASDNGFPSGAGGPGANGYAMIEFFS